MFTRRRCCFTIAGIWVSGAVMSTALSPRWSIGILTHVFSAWQLLLDVQQKLSTSYSFCDRVHHCNNIRAIVRTHRQITSQRNSIAGHIDFVGNLPSLTSQSIRSGRNVLIMDLAYIFLTIPAAVYATTVIARKENDVTPSSQFVAAWTGPVIRLSIVFDLILFRYVRM